MQFRILPKGLIPVRALIATQLFLACFVSYMLRVNMSLNIIAMVDTTSTTENSTSTSQCAAHKQTTNATNLAVAAWVALPDYGPRYNWSKQIQGVILSSFFWGYMATGIPAGYVSEKFGAARVVLVSTLLSGALTLFTPLAASWHYSLVIVDRFLLGVAGGVLYPALHCLIARWSPPNEKGKFVASLLGGTLGTVATWPLVGTMIDSIGWIWAFFIPGGVALIWCLMWWYIVTDTPEENRWISEEEKMYIAKSIGGTVNRSKKVPPYKDFLLSVPFWALTVLHFGNLWGMSLLLTSGPMFLSEALGFDIKSSGSLAAIPYLARLIFGLIFGTIGDCLRSKDIMTTTMLRKSFVTFSHFIPALFMYGIIFTECSAIAAVTLVTFSLGINGASTVTNLQNAQDLAPNFAGSIYGIVNCIGGIANLLAPLLTSTLTAKRSGLYEWHIVFMTGASIYLGCGIMYLIFGSGKLQPYNEIETQEFVDGRTGVDNPAFEKAVNETKFDEDVSAKV